MSVPVSPQQLLLGLGIAVAIGLTGWLVKALSVSGLAAAIVTGTIIFGLGGLPWAALMVAFFISSSLLSRLFAGRKQTLAEKFEKGGRRDWGQVFANGAVGAFLAVVVLLLPGESWPWLAFAGAMAAVNADTWATELGVLSSKQPRLITNGKAVPVGTSGGITLMGTLSTLAGGAFIALAGWVFAASSRSWGFIAAVSLGGLVGSLVDSLLGATIQAIYFNPLRDKETERVILQPDGSPAKPVRGFPWMNNDMVNLMSSMCGALTAALLGQWFNS
ncbi:MAG: DUF92 domain-containing protein [Anaerolineales bacterium]